MNNVLFVNYQNTGVADGSAEKPYPTIGQALAAMTGAMGGYILHVAPGVYMEKEALETPAAGLIVYGNGSTLYANGGITYKGKFMCNELTVSGTATVDGGSVDMTVEMLYTMLLEKTKNGVYTGLVVAAQDTPGMTVKISAGTVYMSDGTRYVIAAKASQAITAANATNPRKDIIYVSSSGVISYLAGTAASSPSAPATPTGAQLLAEISVPANDTTISTDQITDKRTMLNA